MTVTTNMKMSGGDRSPDIAESHVLYYIAWSYTQSYSVGSPCICVAPASQHPCGIFPFETRTSLHMFKTFIGVQWIYCFIHSQNGLPKKPAKKMLK
jgi:hypothetical protein